MARISLTGLRARGTHGVVDHEKVEPQDFVVDVEMWLEISQAAATDDVANTVSYAEVADVVVAVIEGEHADLIETLADRIVRRLAEFPVDGMKVTVHKPHAPIPHEFADVAVTQEWWRHADLFGDDELDEALLNEAMLDEALFGEGLWDGGLPDDGTWEGWPLYEAVISLGSNLDEPHMHLRQAVRELKHLGEVTGVSSVYETAPQLQEGQAGQPNYLNAVATLMTSLQPEVLLADLQFIEDAHGRNRGERWGARTLDLDIVTALVSLDDDQYARMIGDIPAQMPGEGGAHSGVEIEWDSPSLTLPHPRAHHRRFVLEPWLEIEPEAVLGGRTVAELRAALPDQGVRRIEGLDLMPDHSQTWRHAGCDQADR